MSKLLYLIAFLSLFIGCKRVQPDKKSDLVNADSLKYISLVQATIDIPCLQVKIHDQQEEYKQKEVIIVNNNIDKRYIAGMSGLKIAGYPIKIMTKQEVDSLGFKVYFLCEDISINDNFAEVIFDYYPRVTTISTIHEFKLNHWYLRVVHGCKNSNN